jgi:hypothetical protein
MNRISMVFRSVFSTRALGTFLTVGLLNIGHAAWQPAKGPLTTRWAEDVKPSKALQEYPRPQMVRREWANLNGLWDYAIVDRTAAQPSQWDGQILVPFPVESALSGVMKPVTEKQKLWYHREFRVPAAWKGQRVLLHFGAVDWEATVWVNGKELGTHRGGYDGFSFDITEALQPSGEQQVVVAVWDPTDRGAQARGKQVLKPGGIMYTASTGIWQTPWLEPVNPVSFAGLKYTSDLEEKRLEWKAILRGLENARLDDYSIEVTAYAGTNRAAAGKFPCVPGGQFLYGLDKFWSPDAPFLYDLVFALKYQDKVVDEVKSYVGMRKISMAKDEEGILRLCLNNKPLFQYGPLDQGFWPDGLYTAPTDEALRYDIEMTKALGMNMARKHVKVEPDRWYYWCDKLGLLVWQDMPSGQAGDSKSDAIRPGQEEAAKQFEVELKALVEGLWNHPSIVMWVPFNEGWGQYDTPRITELVKKLDPTRLVNGASGWVDRKVGDVSDIHSYPGPGAPKLEEKRAAVLGEFGGLGLPVKSHTWQAEKNWGYRNLQTSEELTEGYLKLIDKLHPLTGTAGLCAAVYTQTTDCEVEVNGLMTYDRALVKLDQTAVTTANRTLYTRPPERKEQGGKLAPPAAPLVACDPYFSIWSPADHLADADTIHWTGKPHRLASLVRVDGRAYRVMGAEPRRISAATPEGVRTTVVQAFPQTSLSVLPTRTIYKFEGAGVALTLTFLTPALPEDLDLLSRPVTYLTWEFHAVDGKEHEVQLYFDASAELAVNQPSQQVVWSSEKVGDLKVLKVGSKEQPVLAKKGDDLRIDWGYLYLAVPSSGTPVTQVAERGALESGFAAKPGSLAQLPALEQPTTAGLPAAAVSFDLGKVSAKPVTRWLVLAYDDLFSIQYMKQNLRPYWRRNGWEAGDLLKAAAKDYAALLKRCAAFDDELMADLSRAGGEKYAKLCALAYRQCFAAGKFVADANGQPLSFCKENHSNGCIATSDVFYPMAPQFLFFGPSLTKSFLVPFMNYAASDRWKFPFAPHDLGTYPKANGQVYGDGERGVNNQMPVEESGNLLCLIAALAQMEGHANFASLYWKQLEQWAEYLKQKGFDPENQLCTDDFAGHLAHNVNLSAKAICGLGAFAKLCELRGDQAKADEYFRLGRDFAAQWVKAADEGDHFRLAYDRPGTWSQKYNLVWDRVLGLNLFPAEVLRKEMDYYRKIQNKYGLPLDNRETYTKLDWILWTATLTQNRGDFETLVNPVFRFLNETPDRSPMTDWYQTKTARKVGFTARPVVGGVFMQMLYDKAVWQKYVKRDQTKADHFAPMPRPPVTRILLPTAKEEAAIRWRYTTQKPAENWFQPDFDAGAWKEGPGGFGTRATPGAAVRTDWTTSDIWLRREFTLPEGTLRDPQLLLHHDEGAEVYVNGVPAATVSGFVTDYEILPLSAAAKAALRPGRNILSVHCHQTTGGQYVDAGLVEIVPAK